MTPRYAIPAEEGRNNISRGWNWVTVARIWLNLVPYRIYKILFK